MFRTEFKEMVNTAIQNLYNQGQPSLSEEQQCRYRGCNGNKCIVGWMIPDENYNENFEGTSAYGLIQQYPKLLGVEQKKEERLLSRLQDIHDALDGTTTEEEFRERFVSYLEQLKKDHGEIHSIDWIILPK